MAAGGGKAGVVSLEGDGVAPGAVAEEGNGVNEEGIASVGDGETGNAFFPHAESKRKMERINERLIFFFGIGKIRISDFRRRISL